MTKQAENKEAEVGANTKARAQISKHNHPTPPETIIIKPTPKFPNTFKQSLQEFQNHTLEWHNYYRALHGVPPLQLDERLSAFADEWAQELANLDKFEHRPIHDYGENIYLKWSSKKGHQITGKETIESWYREIEEYNFHKEPDMDKIAAVGHFTQLVWKNSKRIGIARSRNHNNKIFVVANYDPPGNIIGEYLEQVPRPIFRHHLSAFTEATNTIVR